MLHFALLCYLPDVSKYDSEFAFSYSLELYCPIKTQVSMQVEMEESLKSAL